jgi:hypothetical protein
MATTKRLTFAAICHTNLITRVASLVSATSQQNNYPASRLLDPIRSNRTRSADMSDMLYTFDLKSAVHPTCIGFIDANFMNIWGQALGSYVQLSLADDSALSTNLVTWNIPVIQTVSPNNVANYYLDVPTSGTWLSNTVRRYLGLRIYAASQIYALPALTYIELGGLFVGYHLETTVDPSSDFGSKDDSVQTRVRSGAVYTDVEDTYTGGSINVGQADLATEVFPARAAILAGGNSGRVILDNAAMSSDVTRRGNDVYYGRIRGDNLFTQRIEQATRRSFAFDFEEDNG